MYSISENLFSTTAVLTVKLHCSKSNNATKRWTAIQKILYMYKYKKNTVMNVKDVLSWSFKRVMAFCWKIHIFTKVTNYAVNNSIFIGLSLTDQHCPHIGHWEAPSYLLIDAAIWALKFLSNCDSPLKSVLLYNLDKWNSLLTFEVIPCLVGCGYLPTLASPGRTVLGV